MAEARQGTQAARRLTSILVTPTYFHGGRRVSSRKGWGLSVIAGTQRGSGAAPIERIDVSAYKIPTDAPEADGTFAWDSTTLVVVELRAGGQQGLGYTYADAAAANFLSRVAAEQLRSQDAMDIPARMIALLRQVRNLGRPGLIAMALSAVDTAL